MTRDPSSGFTVGDLANVVERLRAERDLADKVRGMAEDALDAAEVAFERVERERDAWKARAEALDKLLVCYRLGRQPTEKLHRELERTRAALDTKDGT